MRAALVDDVSTAQESEGVKQLEDGVARLVNDHGHHASIARTQTAQGKGEEVNVPVIIATVDGQN